MVKRAFVMISLLQLLTRRISFFCFSIPNNSIHTRHKWLAGLLSVASWRTLLAQQAIPRVQCSAMTQWVQKNNSTIFLNIFIKVTYTAIQNTDLFCWDYGVESVLSYLPLSHVAGQMMDVFLIMSKVSRTWKMVTLLWFNGHFNLAVGRDLLFCGQGRA